MVDGPHLLHTAKKFLLPNSMVHLPAVLEMVGTLRKKSTKRFYLCIYIYILLSLLLYIIDIHDDPNIPLLPASWRPRIMCVNSRPAYVFNFLFSFSSLQRLTYFRYQNAPILSTHRICLQFLSMIMSYPSSLWNSQTASLNELVFVSLLKTLLVQLPNGHQD